VTKPNTDIGSSPVLSVPKVPSRVQAGAIEVKILAVRPGLGARPEQHQVVPGLGDPEAEDPSGHRVLEHEVHRGLAGAVHGAGHPDPHLVHVDRERGGGGGAGEPLLLAGHLLQGQPQPAELRGHHRPQVAGVDEVREVLVEEAVLPVGLRGPAADPVEQLVGEQGGGAGHLHTPRRSLVSPQVQHRDPAGASRPLTGRGRSTPA
jgi:hypothetical protein